MKLKRPPNVFGLERLLLIRLDPVTNYCNGTLQNEYAVYSKTFDGENLEIQLQEKHLSLEKFQGLAVSTIINE